MANSALNSLREHALPYLLGWELLERQRPADGGADEPHFLVLVQRLRTGQRVHRVRRDAAAEGLCGDCGDVGLVDRRGGGSAARASVRSMYAYGAVLAEVAVDQSLGLI